MRAVDIIIKKRDREALTQQEIDFFIQGYAQGDIPDYQAAAWAMAVLLNGMTSEETTALTQAMVASGETLDLSGVVKVAVDKHSTGGVGDKTTLVVAPLVSACGLPVGKMSGRGLGFSGGTLDKLESVPGFRCDLSTSEFLKQLRESGIVVTGQSMALAPADGKLYALRDVTGTVQSLPLIASSVMSKKLASGAHAIVLDVKWGLGAFMATLEEARHLAQLMVEIARLADRKAVALLSDMNQPLGCAVGNALELKEAIETLRGGGPDDFREHCLETAAHMLVLGGVVVDAQSGRELASQALADGSGLELLRVMIAAQGGDVRYIDQPEKLPKAAHIIPVEAGQSGYLSQVHARLIGEASVLLGGGRERKGDTIDHAVGIVVHCNVGDQVEAGQPLFTIHANDTGNLEQVRSMLTSALAWSADPVEALPLFYGLIE
ncbi:MAG: thymidine phosphorylase [Anaerolineales bacterium]|nr:thymidine phosphorylase [Anaerolineales bacterium]